MVVGLVVGGGGLEFKLRFSPCATEELDAVDVVSFKLRVVSLGSLGFEEAAFEFIPVATALGNELIVVRLLHQLYILSSYEGAYAVSRH